MARLRPSTYAAMAFSLASDILIAATFLITWIDPAGVGARPLAALMLTMLLEFIIIHSAAFMGHAWTSDQALGRRMRTMIGFALFYMLFVGAWAWGFEVWWPVGAFTILVVNRLLSMLFDPHPSDVVKERLEIRWGRATALFVAFAFVTTFLPIPPLGIDADAVSSAHIPGGGLWVEQPHRVIAFGFLYFGFSAGFEARMRWRQIRVAAPVRPQS